MTSPSCCCSFKFEWSYGFPYTSIYKFQDSDGTLLLERDHGADVYCVAANSNYVYIGGDRAADGKTTRVYDLSGVLQLSVDHGEGTRVVGIAADGSGNFYTNGWRSGGLGTSSVQSGGGGNNAIVRLNYGLQTLAGAAIATGGTFRLIVTVGGLSHSTGDIAYNASAAMIEAAIEAITEVGSGNVSCSGGPLDSGHVDIEFINTWANSAAAVGLDTVFDALTGLATVRKYNSSGVLQWSYDHGNISTGKGIAVDGSGNVYFCHGGTHGNGTTRGTFTKVNSSGTHQWTHKPGGVTLDVATDGTDVYIAAVTLAAGKSFRVEITGAPTGGTFTLTLDGNTTAAIAYNASTATVKSAIEALANVTTCSVTGGLPGIITVTVSDPRTDYTLSSANSLTGGSTPSITITELRPGDGGATAGTLRKLAAAGTISWTATGVSGAKEVAYASTLHVYADSPFRVIQNVNPSTGAVNWTESTSDFLTDLATGGSGDYFTTATGGFNTIARKFNSSRVQQWSVSRSSVDVYRGVFHDGTNVWVVGDRVQS